LGILALKLIDRMVGGIATALLPAPARGTCAEPRRILVIRPGGMGDAVLLIPALLALKDRFPAAEITLLAERRNAAAFSLCPAVDRVLLYERVGDLVSAVRGGYDVVIDTEQWHRLSAVVARTVGARVSVGFASNSRSRLFSHPVSYRHEDYEVESFFKLLAPLGVDSAAWQPGPFLSLPAAASQRAGELLAPLGGKRFVALFPGASIVERRWGAARFRAVAEQLAERGIPVVVVGGECDAAEARVVVGGECDAAEAEAVLGGVGGLNLAGRTTLAETAAVIAQSALLLSGDSGVLHLAVGLGVPTVSLFGPGIEAKWGPKGEGHVVLNKHLPCSPCTRFGTTPPCPIKARCLSDISVAEVVAAVEKLLGFGF
jgi:heptosyltransferase II